MRAGRVLAVGLMISAAAAAQERLSAPMLMALNRGQYRVLIQNAARSLEKDPDDAEMHALMGIAWSRLGYHADSVGVAPLAMGAHAYELRGIAPHANSLRVLGRGAEAVALREQLLLNEAAGEGQELTVWLDTMDDLRTMGQPEEALEAGLWALSVYPQSPQVHAMFADVYMDMEQWEEADFHLWLYEQYGTTSRGVVALARRAFAEGVPQRAALAVEVGKKKRFRTNRFTATQAEVMRQSGYPADAIELLERNQWLLTEDPDLMAARIRAYADLRRWSKAEPDVDRARSVYASYPEIRAALAYYDEKRPRRAGVP